MPVPVARHHSASAGGTSSTVKKPLARAASHTGSPDLERREPRRERTAGHDDEVELVRTLRREGSRTSRAVRASARAIRAARAARGARTARRRSRARPRPPRATAVPASSAARARHGLRARQAWPGEPVSVARIASMVARPDAVGMARVTCGRRRRATPRAFLAAVQASRALHGAWVAPPSTPALYRAWLGKLDRPRAARAQRELARVPRRRRLARGHLQLLRDRARRVPQRLSRLLRLRPQRGRRAT